TLEASFRFRAHTWISGADPGQQTSTPLFARRLAVFVQRSSRSRTTGSRTLPALRAGNRVRVRHRSWRSVVHATRLVALRSGPRKVDHRLTQLLQRRQLFAASDGTSAPAADVRASLRPNPGLA